MECCLDFGVPGEFIQSPGECVGHLRGQGEALEVLRLGTQHKGQDMRQSGPQEVLSQAGLEAHSGFPVAGKQPRDGGG